MARFASVLLAVAFVFPTSAFAGSSIRPGDAVAASDDEDLGDDDGDLVRGKSAVDDKKAKGKTTSPVPSDDEEDEPVEDFEMEDMEEAEDEDEPSERLGNFEEDDELSVEAPVRKVAPPSAAAAPGPITLSVAGKTPLADNYPMTVVAVDRDAVVIELPVLVARSRVAVEKGFVLIAEVFVGDVKVSEVQQTVTPQSLAEFGPSFAYLKVLAPVIDHAGEVRIVVKQADIGGANAKPLFTRSTPYALN